MTAFAKTIVVRLRARITYYDYICILYLCVYLRARRPGRFMHAYYDIFII